MLGLENVLERGSKNIEIHLRNLFAQNRIPGSTYQIVIIWQQERCVMTDLWLFSDLESADTGFTVSCLTFQGFKRIEDNGITASDGLIILGRETELEEDLRKQGEPVQAYVNGQRPALPMELVSDFEF